MTTAVEKEVQAVTFYHWIDKYPSSEKIHISGGESRIATNGEKIQNAEVLAEFHNGTMTTSNPIIIKEMRRHIAMGSTITEDRETYYTHVLKPEEVTRRTVALNQQLAEENEKLKKEQGRLVEQLEAKGKKEPKV